MTRRKPDNENTKNRYIYYIQKHVSLKAPTLKTCIRKDKFILTHEKGPTLSPNHHWLK